MNTVAGAPKASTSSTPYALTFSFDDASSTDDKAVLGGKGAGLVSMTRNGLTVPPGYILSTECCHHYLASGSMSEVLTREVLSRLAELEAHTGKTFGDGPSPLLLSVRSGAPVSMPGMMDTVLNLGLNRSAALALASMIGDTAFMADVLFRFHGMYSEIVLGVLDVPDRSELDTILEHLGVHRPAAEVYDSVWEFCQTRLIGMGEETVPDDPKEQLLRAIEAVFRSWNTRRAITYRELHRIPHEMGTAVVVQSMVFGNVDKQSGSGVVFSRNPVTGNPGLFGEFLTASQGEDVVAGTRTPDPIANLHSLLPDVFDELTSTVARLEVLNQDVLDIEFTIEHGILYFLQVRSAKRTAPAAIRIASDFLSEGSISDQAVLQMLTVDQVRQVQRPGFDPAEVNKAKAEGHCVAQGIGASPGQVSGMLSLDPDRAVILAKTGARVILARQVTSPTDLHGMIAADGILTATGGATSHAAVVARALGKSCVVGCSELVVDPRSRTVSVDDCVLTEGDLISVDGATGEIFDVGLTLTQPAAANEQLGKLLQLASERSKSTVLVRATTEEQIRAARAAGLPGVVAAVVDVLATSSRFQEVVESLRSPEEQESSFGVLEDVIAEQFALLFMVADGMDFNIRALDFLIDEMSDVLDSRTLAVEFPHLAMPLGSRELIGAQLRGIARAAASADYGSTVSFSVRNISDVAEAHALRAIRDELDPSARITLGIYITSPRGALAATQLGQEADFVWVELRMLQAAMFGLPAEHLLTREPLDRYSSRGLLSVNPRESIDPSVQPLLDSIAQALPIMGPDRIGIRISGEISESLISALHGIGFRRFAVDAGEGSTARLALGKASTG